MTVPIMAEPIGTTRALQEVSVRARVRGFLKEIHFKEGGDVKEGQLLFVIDEEPFKAKLAEAQAALEQAEAVAEEGAGLQGAGGRDGPARRWARRCSHSPRSRSGASSAAQAQRRPASRTSSASRRMRQKDAAQVDAYKASLDQAKADYETNIIAAQADVAGAKARVTDAQIDLSYCRMSSPIDGRIGLAEVKLGNLVGPAAGGRRLRLHRARGRPATRPDGGRHPGLVPLPRPGDAADRPGAPGRGLPARPRGGGGPPVPRQGDRHRQHDRPDDLHLPGPGGGRQPGEDDPARRVREGRRQGGRGQGRGRRPRAGRGRDPGRPDGLHRRRAGQGGRRPRPGDLHLRGPSRPRIGPRTRPARDRGGAADGPRRDDGQDRAGPARRAPATGRRRRPSRRTRTADARQRAKPPASRTRSRDPRPDRASPTDADPASHRSRARQPWSTSSSAARSSPRCWPC